jgi:hypothetical protein
LLHLARAITRDFRTKIRSSYLSGSPKQESWYLEYRPARETDAALLAFRNWLQGEAELQRQIEADLLDRSARPTLRKRAARA